MDEKKLEQNIEQKNSEYKNLKKKNKVKLLIPTIIGATCIFLMILGMSMMQVNIEVASVFITYPLIILIIDAITLGILYTVLKNKEAEIETEIKTLNNELEKITNPELTTLNTNEKNKKTKKRILVPILCAILIAAIIIPIVCILTQKKQEYITLQYKTVNTTTEQIEVKVEINNKTQKTITFYTSDFTIKKDGLPIEADNFLVGYSKTISPSGSSSAIIVGYDVDFKINEKATLVMYFKQNYDNIDKPFKIYYQGKEILFENTIKIDK